jgi:hypothetical protein
MLNYLQHLDRRWIFLMMAIAVAIPIVGNLSFREQPGQFAKDVFDAIEELKPGDPVLMAWDYDPSTEGELGPMATAFAVHCCEKKAKLYFITLLPVGPQMVEQTIEKIVKADYPSMVYGVDYVNLGFKSGNEGVIKVIITNLRGLYTTDARGTNIDQIPMCRDIDNIQKMKLIVNVSGAYPGTKEWVQYAVSPHQGKLKMVGGSTGVQSPQMFPYIPGQLAGMLTGIKGAAEYEQLVVSKYRGEEAEAKYLQARRRMGPQAMGHVLMIGLIILGNVLYFTGRR